MGTSASPKPLIIPIFIPHRGCPHRCTFCNQTCITAEAERLPPPADLEARITAYLAYAGPDRGPAQVAFYGGNFLGLEEADITALLDRLEPWLTSGRVSGIRFSTRPDTITPKRLAWIASYPVHTIELGVQSMNDAVLAQSRRGHTAADTRRAMERLQSTGYETGIQLMLGLPGDTSRRALETAQAVIQLKPDLVRIYPTLVISGSALAASFSAGRYSPMSLKAAVAMSSMLLRLFRQHHIRVIRLGLQAADGLEDPTMVLAGPYHPAFGHLVYSAIYHEAAQALLNGVSPLPQKPVLRVHPHHLSRLQGLGKQNLDLLRHHFERPLLAFETTADLPLGQLACGDRQMSVWSLPPAET